jgi:hypothetical protein
MERIDRVCCCFCCCIRLECTEFCCCIILLAAAEEAEESRESTEILPETESVVETSELVDGDEDLGHEDETVSISTEETSETLATEDEFKIAQDLSPDESDRVEQLVTPCLTIFSGEFFSFGR